jgi:uncharacterized integral membrane protein
VAPGVLKRVDDANIRIPGTRIEGWRAIAVGAVALYLLLFIALNNHKVEVNFVFFKIRSHELLAFVLIVALSFGAGFFVRGRYVRGSAAGSTSPSAGAAPRELEAGTQAALPDAGSAQPEQVVSDPGRRV